MTTLNHQYGIEVILPSTKYLTSIIKKILKNERVSRDQNRKSTGRRLLWQQNEIPLPHNNCTYM